MVHKFYTWAFPNENWLENRAWVVECVYQVWFKSDQNWGSYSESKWTWCNIRLLLFRFLSLRGCEKNKKEKEKNENLHDNGAHEVQIRECQYRRFRHRKWTKLGMWIIYILKIFCMDLHTKSFMLGLLSCVTRKHVYTKLLRRWYLAIAHSINFNFGF